MNTFKHRRGAFLLLLTLVFAGNLLIPQAAQAGGGDGKKKPSIPIIVGKPVITHDPPKKHDESGQ